ncbi:MAG: hypothetical protein CVV10_02025 [Gammaproteobacteria bacterium HGW-Gammaproteobacteria-14]|nr:MAG: hypothetical protein CVV10_02025 [Gammaproteobacteria bacterium HGW-Gammaproteobacteria-14]
MSNLSDPRVFFAAERTLLAWNRTGLALIAFGFLVERAGLLMKVLLQGTQGGLDQIFTLWLGVLFIVLGALVSLLSVIQHRVVLNTLSPEEIPHGYRIRWAMLVNLAVSLLGVVLALGLLFLTD